MAAPVIVPADGVVLTVIVASAFAVPQPLVTVYDIIDVPAATPVTTPPVVMVALAVFELLHVPPATPSVSAVVEPSHTVVAPEIVPAFGTGLTVHILIAEAVPQLLFTV
jgi:hypothetical protein